MKQINYFSRTLINSLLTQTTGIVLDSQKNINDTIKFTDNYVEISMFIDDQNKKTPILQYTFNLKDEHAKTLQDVEGLKRSLERAKKIIALTKTLFEFQNDFYHEIQETYSTHSIDKKVRSL